MLEEQWQRNEELLDSLKQDLDKLVSNRSKPGRGKGFVEELEREKSLTRQYRELAHTQNELEAFLVEHEAPGWTST